jgi:nucleoid DNA-binding protein
MRKQIGLKHRINMGKSDEKNNTNMESIKNTNNDNREVLVYFATKRKPKFKAGAELSDKVNKANFIFDNFSSEKYENFKISFELILEDGEKLYYSGRSKRKTRFKAGADLTDKVNLTINGKPLEMMQSKKKTRFKAGADLTEKVNMLEVQMFEQIIDEKIQITIEIKL